MHRGKRGFSTKKWDLARRCSQFTGILRSSGKFRPLMYTRTHTNKECQAAVISVKAKKKTYDFRYSSSSSYNFFSQMTRWASVELVCPRPARDVTEPVRW